MRSIHQKRNEDIVVQPQMQCHAEHDRQGQNPPHSVEDWFANLAAQLQVSPAHHVERSGRAGGRCERAGRPCCLNGDVVCEMLVKPSDELSEEHSVHL